MTIREQIEFVRGALADWATTWSAEAKLAADRSDVFRQLVGGPDRSHCYVYFEGEEPVEAYRASGGVERTILVVLSRGRGLSLDDAGNLVCGPPGEQPLFDLVEACRDILATLNFVPTQNKHANDRDQVLPTYGGIRPWRGVGYLPLDAFEIEIRILTQLVFA